MKRIIGVLLILATVIIILSLLFSCSRTHESNHQEKVKANTEESLQSKFRYKKGDMVYSRLDSTKYIITNVDMVVADYWAVYTDKNGVKHDGALSDAELY